MFQNQKLKRNATSAIAEVALCLPLQKTKRFHRCQDKGNLVNKHVIIIIIPAAAYWLKWFSASTGLRCPLSPSRPV